MEASGPPKNWHRRSVGSTTKPRGCLICLSLKKIFMLEKNTTNKIHSTKQVQPASSKLSIKKNGTIQFSNPIEFSTPPWFVYPLQPETVQAWRRFCWDGLPQIDTIDVKQQKKSSGSSFFPVTFWGVPIISELFQGVKFNDLQLGESSWVLLDGRSWWFPTSTPQQQPTTNTPRDFSAMTQTWLPRKYSTWHTWLTVPTYWFKNWPFTNPYLLVSASHLFWP